MAEWSLKRIRQCKKCPWKKGADPHQIPNGYSVERHRALARTIAEPGVLSSAEIMYIMACHEHDSADEVHCVGWLVNQLGPGNNIPLRIRMGSCTNARHLTVDGPQHERFEDTLPPEARDTI